MKKCVKMFSSVLLGLIMILSFGVVVCAKDITDDSEYRLLLDNINKQYGTDIGYYPIDPSKISLAEYEDAARKIAESQRDLELMILSRTSQYDSNDIISDNLRSTKTKDKDVWNYENWAYITATYDVNSNVISNPRNISIHMKPAAIALSVSYSPNIGYPTTSIIDGGRTLAVTYYGTLNNSGISFSNIKFYTEYYYNS